MGTRSTTVIYDGDTPLVTIYRQYDGYPSGHGADVASFLANKELVNGYGLGSIMQFNGAGDLAARLIAFLKENSLGWNGPERGHDDIGNLYIVPFETVGESWEEFLYEVHCTLGAEARIICTTNLGELLVDAPASEFIASIPTEEEE